MRALPGLGALQKRQQNIDHRRECAAADVGDQRRRHGRPVDRPRRERKQPGLADIVDVVAGFAALRAGLAVAGDRAIDQPRVLLAHGLVAEPEPLHHAGAKLLHQHVGARDQIVGGGAAFFAFQVGDELLLAAVQHGEGRRVAAQKRRDHARGLAAGPLDLHDLGAGFGEHQGRERPRQQRGEIGDQNAFERFGLCLRHWNRFGGSMPFFRK